MKTIQKISALLAASATLSMAGVINIYNEDAKKPTASLNLTTIDSLTFSGKAEKKEMGFSGKTKQKAIKLSDMDHIDFKLKDKSKETMTVTVGEGIDAGEHTFKLSEIKNIEIVKMDSEEDMDEDGLTDLEEIYKYDTNPKSADTDGDGWSDKEELADGMYSPTNPTKFNPRIADVPGLSVTLKKSPSIALNIETSEGKSKSKSVTEGKEVSKTSSTSYEQTRSAELMNAWEFSTTHSIEVSWGGGVTDKGYKYTGSISLGYNGSYTSSTGMSWGSSEEKSVSESYETSVSEETSKGSTINGATLCMQVELKNTSDIAFTIEDLKLSASTFDIKDTSSLKIIADLERETGWSKTTLKSGEATDANFCNSDVKIEKIENLIYNTSSIVLGTPSPTITFGKDNDDFTNAYTKVAAKTADITIDYGPGSAGNSSARYQVATNYRYNIDHKGSDDMYAQTSLAELLRNAHVDFKQDSVEGPSKKKFYGLASVDGYKFNLADSAMWYVTIQRAADIKKGLNTVDIYSFCVGSYDMEKIFVGAGDAVHIFYSKDQDHDGVPLPTEYLFGTDDKKEDSDGDGLSDYDEINGWTKGESTVKIYTNPTDADTDGDGLNDKEDPEPTKRPMFKDATLSMLQVFASDPSAAGIQALLSKDSAALAKGRSFDVSVQAPVAYFKVKPNAKKVAQVKVTANTNTATMQFVQPNADGVYSFQTPGALTVLKNSSVKIVIRSEDGADSACYTVSISSTVAPPTDLQLGKDADRKKIIANYNASADTRVKGYVILRGVKGSDLPENIENEAKITPNGTYKSFTSFMIEGAGKNSYVDGVDGGSPYYSYRVYAYTKEYNGTDSSLVFSKGTEQHTRSVGRIKLEYKWTDFGGEYFELPGGAAYRADITGKVSLYEGNSTSGYQYGSTVDAYDTLAGKWNHNATIYYLSSEFDKGDRKPAGSTYTANVGSQGLYLYLEAHADKGGKEDMSAQGIYWSYDNMAKVLNGESSLATGENEKAPKRIDPSKALTEANGGIEYLIGKKGIEYNDNDNVCDDCGDEPHAGFWFAFKYDWVDDDDFY